MLSTGPLVSRHTQRHLVTTWRVSCLRRGCGVPGLSLSAEDEELPASPASGVVAPDPPAVVTAAPPPVALLSGMTRARPKSHSYRIG